MDNKVLKATDIVKFFYQPEPFKAIRGISFDVNRGEFLSLIGKSGSGKSTLLYILSSMDTEYEGQLEINGTLLTGLSQDELAKFRNEHIGFVFQFHYLLPEFTCLRNVMIPAMKLIKYTPDEIENRAYEKLKLLGVHEQALKPASKLSGGQQQRVAIARALINEPTIIMGDEPTGNLDTKNSRIVLEIFKKLQSELNQTIITVTHDQGFANSTDRIVELSDGVLVN